MDSAAKQDVLLLASVHDRIKFVINSLPVIDRDTVSLDDTCPICLMPFASIFADELCLPASESKHASYSGVTRLVGCGHLFCRKDLVEWIRSFHGSCPTCRHTFLDVRPPSDSDDESSDGGEYIPNEEEDEDDDAFLDTAGFSDTGEFEMDEMELDSEDIWEGDVREDEVMEWGSADRDFFSDGDISSEVDQELDQELGQEVSEVEVDIAVSGGSQPPDHLEEAIHHEHEEFK